MDKSLRAKEKFVFNLLRPEDRSGKTTILYIVYKTIEANLGITVNQLKWVLEAECMIHNDVVAASVAALTSKSLFNCVSRWQPPKGQSGNSRNEAVHLRVRNTAAGADFEKWYSEALAEFPELSVFVPPLFVNSQAGSSATVNTRHSNASH